MTATQLAPYVGYLGSLLLMIGLLVTTDLKFRIWNGLGCLAFIIYALFIEAMPVLLTNAVLLAINAFYFIKIIRRKENFDAAIVSADDVLVNKFLDFYQADMEIYFPGVRRIDLSTTKNIVVLRDLVIANFCALRIEENNTAKVIVNYTTPKYRDFKVGQYLFNTNKELLLKLGVHAVLYDKVTKKSHAEFLKKSGFSPIPNSESGMRRDLQ